MAAADIRTGSYAVIRDFQRAGARSAGIFHDTNKWNNINIMLNYGGG